MSNKSSDVLTPEIRRFISNNFESVAMLEILFFFRKEKGQEWSVEQVEKALKSSSMAIETRINELIKKGFLKYGSSRTVYQYGTVTDGLDRLVEKLEKLYPKFQVRVIEQIYNPRPSAIKDFADAFRLKSED